MAAVRAAHSNKYLSGDTISVIPIKPFGTGTKQLTKKFCVVMTRLWSGSPSAKRISNVHPGSIFPGIDDKLAFFIVIRSFHAAMKIINAFATPISVLRCAQAPSINDKLHAIIKTLSIDEPSDDRGRAHIGGWYSRGGFLAREEPEIATLRAFFKRSVEGYLAKAVSKKFSQSAKLNFHTWVALTQPKEYQPPHIHPKSHISGVYYVKVPKAPKPQGALELMTPVGEQELAFFSQVSPTSINVQPTAGDLVIFPSYIRHFTHPYFDGSDRSLVVFTVNCF